MLYIAEITAAVDDAGTLQTFLFGTREWCTLPTDTPANTPVRNRLLNPGSFARDMGSGRSLFGAVRATRGELSLLNLDGALDTFARYGMDWRSVTLRCCDSADGAIPAYPSGWTTAVVSTVDAVQLGFESVNLRLRDPLDRLDRPLCATYAGTGGIEGPVALAGTAKPRVYGGVSNATPVCIDAANNVWQISDRPVLTGIWTWDKRAWLQIDNYYDDAISLGDLTGRSVSSGHYVVCSGLGLVKIGAEPNGRLTADAARRDDAYTYPYGRQTLGQVLYDIATDAGLIPDTDFDSGIESLDRSAGGCGIFVQDLDTTVLDALGLAAETGAAWIGSNRLGVLSVGLVASPSGTPVWTFTRDNCCDDSPLDLAVGAYPVPIGKAVIRGGRNWTLLSPSEIDASVSSMDAQLLGQSQTYVEQANGTAAAKHPSSQPEVFNTCGGGVSAFMNYTLPGSGAGFSASTALALFGVERDYAIVRAPITIALLTAVDLGAVVSIRWNRFGFDAGKLFMVIGVAFNFASNEATFTVWG